MRDIGLIIKSVTYKRVYVTDAVDNPNTTAATVTTSEYFTLQTYGNSGNLLDDIVMLELDGDTWETETYAYPPTADLRYAENEFTTRCQGFAIVEKDGPTPTPTTSLAV